MKGSITAIGTAVPQHKFKQSEVAVIISERLQLGVKKKRLLKSIYKATGIESRHSVISDMGQLSNSRTEISSPDLTTAGRMALYKEHALPLAVSAIKQCMEKSEATLSDITHVITVSCTGMYAPGLDIEIVQQLKLRTNTKRTAINFMGCYGAFNALKLADDACRANKEAVVLVVSVELCSLHFQDDEDLDHLLSNALFSDGAAAVLIQPMAEDRKSLSIEAFNCDLLPQTSEDMAWKIGDSGFDIVLKSYIPEVIESGIAEFMDKLLKQEALSRVDHYAIHPGGVKILQACETALDITKDKNKHAYHVMREYGNMSSATILFVLKELMAHLTGENHQETVFSCAFGPGLTLESMLLKINQPH
jgi:predicted naringenin-chalcone synthase